VIHGRFSRRFARDSPVAQAAIDQALADPELMDCRRPVAIATVLLQEHGLIPDDELVVEVARAAIPAHVRDAYFEKHGEEIEPTEAQLALTRRRMINRAMQANDTYSRTVATALRQTRAGELMTRELIPAFEELASHVRRLVMRYVPDEDQEAFVDGFRQGVKRVIVRAAQVET